MMLPNNNTFSVTQLLSKKILISFAFIAAFFTQANAETVKLETDLGEITVNLFSEQAPATVENFLTYVDDGFYNGTIFHRVIPGFMVQGGGLTFDFTEKETREPVVNESHNGLRNARGTLAMARYSDPNSATAQFFINLVNNPHLDNYPGRPGYTVFGEVISGMEVVDEIVTRPPGNTRRHPNAPSEPIRILKAYRVEATGNNQTSDNQKEESKKVEVKTVQFD